MEPKETRFSYVYDEIKRRIANGIFPANGRLPSSRRLCEEFHVGTYTVNHVLKALKEDGLIDIQPRQAAVVCSSVPAPPPEFSILRQRNKISQVYHTFALIMPPLLAFTSRDCPFELMPHYEQALQSELEWPDGRGWRPISAFLGKEILQSGGNHLLSSLYTAVFELEGSLTFFTEQCPYFSDRFLQRTKYYFQNGETNIFAIHTIQILMGSDPAEKYRDLATIYQRLAEAVDDTLQHLAANSPQIPPAETVQVAWNPTRGQNYYYTNIVQDLTHKISNGTYLPGDFLPYEGELAQQYGVSVSTIRKALAQLCRRGFTKTINVKGTMVLLPDDNTVSQVLKDKSIQQEALTYLYALQAIMLIIHPVMLRVAPQLVEEDSEKFLKNTQNSSSILWNIVTHSLNRLDLIPLRTILTELLSLTNWGYFITVYPSSRPSLERLNEKAKHACRHLRSKNYLAFADGIADCYRDTLEYACQYMLEKYHFTKARSVQVPRLISLDNTEFCL